MPDLAVSHLVLASASAQRRALLQQIGIEPICLPVNIDETRHPGETAQALVWRLAGQKAAAVDQDMARCMAHSGMTSDAVMRRPAAAVSPGTSDKYAGADSPLLILGGDTVIVLGEQILGKPRSREEAIEMLLQLSGKTHQVLTGVSVLRVPVKRPPISHTIVVASSVTFGVVDVAMANTYWAGGEPAGKAGAYAIQGYGARFVEHLSGSYSNVVGLPLFETARLIDELTN